MSPRTSTLDDILDLVTTWGASADPLAGSLWAGSERGDAPAQRQLAALEAIRPRLPEALQQELALLQEAGHGAPGSPQLARHALELEEKARVSLEAALEERRNAMRRQVEPWLFVLGSERCRDLLGTLAQPQPAGGSAPLAHALDGLDSTEQQWQGLLEELGVELARLPRTDQNADTLKRAESALGQRDADAFGDAWQTLQREIERGKLADQERQLAELRGQIETALAPLEPMANKAPLLQRRTLEDLVHTGRQLLQLAPPERGAELDERLKQARACLAVLQEAADTTVFDTSAESSALLDGLQARLNELGLGETATDAAGPAATAAAWAGQLDQARAQREAATERESRPLHQATRSLEGKLGDLSADLPAGLAAEARIALDTARTSLAGGVSRDAAERAKALKTLESRLDEAAQAERAARKDRQSEAQSTLLRRLESMQAWLPGELGTELERARQRIDEDPDAARVEVDDLERRAGTHVRHEALTTLDLARRGNDESKPVQALRQAVDQDDLAAMRKFDQALTDAPFRRAAQGRPWLIPAASAAAVLLGIAAIWFAKTSLTGPPRYVVRLDPNGADGATITLVRDGKIFAEQDYRSGGNRFRLPAGHYEIYVNQTLTGHSIDVPDDPKNVDGVPVPAGTRR